MKSSCGYKKLQRALIHTKNEPEHFVIKEFFRYFELEGSLCYGFDDKDRNLLYFLSDNKVFVTDIDLEATRRQIHEFFSQYGQVFQVAFKVEKNQFKGKGVVTFYKKEVAEVAVQARS